MLALSSTAAIITVIDISVRAEIQTLKELLERNCKHSNVTTPMNLQLQQEDALGLTTQRSSSSQFDAIETNLQRGAVTTSESNHPPHNQLHRSQTSPIDEAEFAYKVDEQYRSIVRWLCVLRTTVGTVLSTFTVCIVTTVAAFALVDKMLWPHLTRDEGGPGSVDDPHHQYRLVLMLLLAPELLLPLYCVIVGARANSLQSTFAMDISMYDGRGAFLHITPLEARSTLVLRMGTMPLPQITLLGLPITMGALKAALVAISVAITSVGK
eukprot:SAG11_NODE_907_length_6599_cov_13.219231_6_plen_268_part_00